MLQYLQSIVHIRQVIEESNVDLVVNFYEVLCGMAYFIFRPSAPEVCIGHQYLFLHPLFDFPERHKHSQWWLRFFTRLTALGSAKLLALSMRPYPDADRLHMTIVPPLLRDEIKHAVRHHGEHITGYILNAGFAQSVMEWHKAHPEQKLVFFWDKKGAPEETVIDDTLTFHKIDDRAFIRSLSSCRAYATTGGFESVCEAMYMGKPVLMVPAHIEQECNAFDAEHEKAGIASDSFNLDILLDFAQYYEKNINFRMWEDLAETRIIAILEGVAYSKAERMCPSFTSKNLALD